MVVLMSIDKHLEPLTRQLASVLEPVAAQVYFAPECHQAYEKLGFAASPGELDNGVQLPDGPAYFTSRGSVMGQVPGELVAAAFAVFNPDVVVRGVTRGWELTDAVTICEARTEGATAQLERILGEEPEGLGRATELLSRAASQLRPEGRPLYAGLLHLGPPGTPMGNMWRLADTLREFRGDAHTAAWISAGFKGPEIGLLSELYWGIPLRTYVRSRAWSSAELDVAESHLREHGLVDGGGFTDFGRTVREGIEAATDRQCTVMVRTLGDDFDELIALLTPWSAAVRAAAGYPSGGPQSLAPART
jgi:hypothetical protein